MRVQRRRTIVYAQRRAGTFIDACVSVVIVCFLLSATASGQLTEPKKVPAEERRFDGPTFRAGLTRRGLNEILALHLAEYPPADRTESLMTMRALRLAESADSGRSVAERRAALAEANRILEHAIAQGGNDRRAFAWRYDLARSTLYEQAEPYLTSVLYFGGTSDDRAQLATLAAIAVTLLTDLAEDLQRENQRVDRLPVPQFDRLDASGYIEELDRLQPQVDYVLLWALWYDSLPRSPSDPVRAARLNTILQHLDKMPYLVSRPHATSGVQIQSLLISGAAHSRLGHFETARDHLTRATEIGARLDDAAERNRVRWAVNLAWLERIRNASRAGAFDSALQSLGKFRQVFMRDQPGDFALRVASAILERSIYRRSAEFADRTGHRVDARQRRVKAWQALDTLARRRPDQRDQLYAILYDMFDPNVDPDSLDPLEQCALVAGLLHEANQDRDRLDRLLERAVSVGERFLKKASADQRTLVPQMLFNTAVAHYRRGDAVPSIHQFLELVRDHGADALATQAATYAVEVASELMRDPAHRDHPETARLYRSALHELITRYADSDAAKYWRFYYAQLLDELKEYGPAATQYALVRASHEHYLLSVFSRMRCAALLLLDQANELARSRPTELQRDSAAFFLLHTDFERLARKRGDQRSGPDIGQMLARSRILAAEVSVLPGVERFVRALESLEQFETEFSDRRDLLGRVWRVRMVAFEKLGRLDDAAQAIPTYIAADAAGAGPTLRSLYFAFTNDADAARQAGDQETANKKTDMALLISEQTYIWATRAESSTSAEELKTLATRRAQSHLNAGNLKRARALFQLLLPKGDAATDPPATTDWPVLMGYAEALYGLDEFERALPVFNRLAINVPTAEPLRWKALLRDLQCRSKLKHDPAGIIKVIEQQAYLYPELGGSATATPLRRLQRKNERRAAAGD